MGSRWVAEDEDGLAAPFPFLHHVALITNDMDRTVRFYRDVLGAEVAQAQRNKELGYRHYFISMAPNTVFAFFEFPDAELPPYLEETRPKSGRALDHICFWVHDEAEWQRWKDRLTRAGLELRFRPNRQALFFTDPNNIVIEIEVGGQYPPFPNLTDPDPVGKDDGQGEGQV